MGRDLALMTAMMAAAWGAGADVPRIEEMRGKSILLFTPHPDDDAFCCGGTLALLAKSGNAIRIVIYTNDDKGSYDPEMTGERLARIRKAEEEEGNRILGIPKENLIWLGHHDGLLEYVDARRLVEQATEVIRRYGPDVVMTVDPGSEYVRWHKTDHRMAAMNTLDAIRAAEFHLYFPNQRLQLGLAHVSQWEPAMSKYRPDWEAEDKAKVRGEMRKMVLKKGGHRVEGYRWAVEFNQF
jgi:LmbE family N-acetylglucosaminyl deacetylase